MSTLAFDHAKFQRLVRRAVAEGVTLLKNDGPVLPLAEGAKIALFGRSQFNYYKSGTGSGGMVNVREVVGVYEALVRDGRFPLNAELRKTYEEWIADHPYDPGVGWASEPWFQAEMPITPELAKKAAKSSDVAIVLIGRTAGEDQDNKNERGSYLLTEEEEKMLENVTAAFEKVVVLLNVGNIIDMNWVKKYNPGAVAYIWQGGQEGGNGALDVISGDVNPAGRLTDTIALDIADYPSTANFGGKEQNFQQEDIYVGYRYFETFARDRVLYPFGFGLSYTEFSIEADSFAEERSGVKATVKVTNVGKCAGRQVVQFYVSKPQGFLGQPARELVDFTKTPELQPGQSCTVDLWADEDRLASYDDSGVTGHKSAYVMEGGSYTFYAGFDVRCDLQVGEMKLMETEVVRQLSEAMAPREAFTRMKPELVDGEYKVVYEDVPLATTTREQHRETDLPREWRGEDMGYKLVDVYDHKCTMEQFIAQFSDQDLICIARGEGMSSPKVTPGCGGAFGGVTDSLLEKGIPVACCTDGPSGIRMDSGRIAFSMPNGACLAASWDLALTEDVYEMEGLELRKNKIDVLLGPGMNLHRNPLNGRNFEYFSEDPLVTGRNAAAQLRGMHRNNVTGTIKHFALNTQESGRYYVEHIASERAIRQIYLKGFEIAVKEGRAKAIMTTYGTVNGFYTSSDYDLCTRILRGEWGFRGIVMSDWWAKGGVAGEHPQLDMASIVRAQNDLYMVCKCSEENTNGDNLEEEFAKGNVTRAELQRNAANICRFILDKPVFNRLIDRGNRLDIQLAEQKEDQEFIFSHTEDVTLAAKGETLIPGEALPTVRRTYNALLVKAPKAGSYKMTLTVRVETPYENAQFPFTIFRDQELIVMSGLKGTEKEWRDMEIILPDCPEEFAVTIFCAMDGIKIREIKMQEA